MAYKEWIWFSFCKIRWQQWTITSHYCYMVLSFCFWFAHRKSSGVNLIALRFRIQFKIKLAELTRSLFSKCWLYKPFFVPLMSSKIMTDDPIKIFHASFANKNKDYRHPRKNWSQYLDHQCVLHEINFFDC